MITSISNKQIKNLIQLQNKTKTRNEQGIFVVEGIKMFEEAMEFHMIHAYFSESFYADYSAENQEKLKTMEFDIVADAVFKQISDTITPQGVLAVVKQPKYELSEILNKESPRLLLLEDLRDPGNLGTIMRTGEGAGISGVILNKGSVDLFNPKTVRSTMGSIFRVPYIYAESIEDTVNILKERGIRLYASHLNGSAYYDEIDYTTGCAFFIGNEASGLQEKTANFADQWIKIPMQGRVESLNAAVAASVLMYESFRQIRNKEKYV